MGGWSSIQLSGVSSGVCSGTGRRGWGGAVGRTRRFWHTSRGAGREGGGSSCPLCWLVPGAFGLCAAPTEPHPSPQQPCSLLSP